MKLAERRGGMREREPVREVSATRGGKRGQQARYFGVFDRFRINCLALCYS
jgi:hypothetical protein